MCFSARTPVNWRRIWIQNFNSIADRCECRVICFSF